MAVVYVQEFAVENGNWSTANYDFAKEQIGDDQGRESLPDPKNAAAPTREVFYELHDVSK